MSALDATDILNKIGYDIIGSAYEVRNTTGTCFRESYYKHALAYELKCKGHKVVLEQVLPVLYKGVEIMDSYRMDLVVDDSVVVEVKALPQVGHAEFRQLMTYLMLSDFKLGYLINFGVEDFTISAKRDRFDTDHGIYRFVNGI